MKKTLISVVVAVIVVMLSVPVNGALSDDELVADASNVNKNDSTTLDCDSTSNEKCVTTEDPFADSKKGKQDKKILYSSDSDCNPISENCKNDLQEVQSASSPSNDKPALAADNVKPTSKGADIAKIVFVDYGRPPHSIHNGPTGDVCGDGTGKYATLSGGIRWNSFPISYTIDASSSGIDTTASKNAVKAAFKNIDDEQHPSGDFFVLTTSNPKITVKWASLDGPGGALAQTTTYYNTATKAIIKADIVFDSGDKWSVDSKFGCSGGGASFDIQNVATHEIGHAIGLGHVADNLLTMYKYASPGETLKSSLGRGDQRGIDKLY